MPAGAGARCEWLTTDSRSATMSRVFTDQDLLTWEAYPSGGKFGLAQRPKVIFHCLSHPDRRARYVVLEGDEADAEELVADTPDDRLREMLRGSRELD